MQVGQSLRDGILAAYYQDSLTRTDTPRLRFYDSSDTAAPALVNMAVHNGADRVIGPLDREQVQTLLTTSSPPVTVIALNRGDGSHPNVIQMALAPEDEVTSLARWMTHKGLRRPLLLAQSGDNSASRFMQIFDEAWTAQGNNQPTLRHQLDSSQKGGIAAAVRQMTEAVKNADSFFLASPAIASQVQPALTYYQQQQPLFTLSSAWDPNATDMQQDLEGISFCGLPWLLTQDRPEQLALYAVHGRPPASHDRLQALGADAWTVAQSVSSLRKGDTLSLRTGHLTLRENGHLTRFPLCAEIRHGMATVVYTPSPPEPPDNRR